MHETESPYEHAKRWLEMFGQCATRLKDVDNKLQELDMVSDDLRSQCFDLPNVKGLTETDRLGALLVSRDERREELREERELLTVATANARRLLVEVARASDNVTVKRGAAFVLARHVHGLKAKDAGAMLGYTKSTAMYYQQKFTQALADHAPDKFTGNRLPFGWYQFARGECNARYSTPGQER